MVEGDGFDIDSMGVGSVTAWVWLCKRRTVAGEAALSTAPCDGLPDRRYRPSASAPGALVVQYGASHRAH